MHALTNVCTIQFDTVCVYYDFVCVCMYHMGLFPIKFPYSLSFGIIPLWTLSLSISLSKANMFFNSYNYVDIFPPNFIEIYSRCVKHCQCFVLLYKWLVLCTQHLVPSHGITSSGYYSIHVV